MHETDQLLRSTLRSLASIERKLYNDAEAEAICREWEQLARVVERMLMVFFIVGTVLFASLILQSHNIAPYFERLFGTL